LTGGPDFLDGTVVASGDATWSNEFWAYNSSYGYDIFASSVSGLDVALGAGTYWLELLNGTSSPNQSLYWDENDGPSTAYEKGSSVPIGSHAFQILGSEDTSVTPEPSSILLLGSGLAGLAGLIKRKLKA